jgi:hypothetical protein
MKYVQDRKKRIRRLPKDITRGYAQPRPLENAGSENSLRAVLKSLP